MSCWRRLGHPGPIGGISILPGTNRRLPPPFRNAPSNYSKRNSTASRSLSLRIPGSVVSRPSGSRFWLALKLGRCRHPGSLAARSRIFPAEAVRFLTPHGGVALVAAHYRRRNREPRASPFYLHLGSASVGLAQRSRKNDDGTRPSLAAPFRRHRA